MLDNSYFRHLTSIDHEDEVFHFFQPIGDPAMLRAEDGTLIASVHVRYQDSNSTDISSISSTTTFKRGEHDLQTLLTHANQPISFHLTNLVNSKGYINVNLMPSQVLASQVHENDPGGYNQWNEISRFRTAGILGNQLANNDQFVLHDVLTSTQSLITVQDDEKSGQTQAKGFAAWIAVHGQSGYPELEALFSQKLEWVTSCQVPWFYIRTLKTASSPISRSSSSSSISSPLHHIGSNGYHLDGYHSEEGCSEDFFPDDMWEKQKEVVQKPPRCFVGECSAPASVDSSVVCKPMPVEDLIQRSTITSLGRGRRMNISTSDTGATYRFDLSAPICRLGLSVQPLLQFNANRYKQVDMDDALLDALRTTFMDAIQQTTQGKFKAFLEQSLSFEMNKQPVCYVCTEEEPKPDVVLFPCGHLCLHSTYPCNQVFDRCGLCRTTISAKLVVKELNVI
ncbi:MAG: hypothetical protein Sylvanvirus26_1 [Sylvanvirus sp.]|uniref:RING-type domain-containing protein n=1 Tax=Sylvanvirus sp. TaxID=2487774 RepID=A0A3G5AK79_9VIRU|nr:MAG: hypothetical protein Sylvanvirus26_1 [Sylvanvirus sp.]